MTKRRESGSFEQASLDVLHALGPQRAGDLVGLSPKTLRDYSDPDRPGRPRLAEALELDRACLDQRRYTPFLEAYLSILANIVDLKDGGDGRQETPISHEIDQLIQTAHNAKSPSA